MRQVFIGVALVIAGIAAFIEASSHAPEYGCPEGRVRCPVDEANALLPDHLSRTPYDLLRIGAWALVIVGGALMVMGFIRYWRTQPRQ
jgi:hypothetical protein